MLKFLFYLVLLYVDVYAASFNRFNTSDSVDYYDYYEYYDYLDSNTGTTQRPFFQGTPATSKFDKKKLLPNDICGWSSINVKILGGSPSDIGEFPWVVALGYSERGSSKIIFACAGSLINSRYVLTAAHCLASKYLQGKTLSVLYLGHHDLKSTSQVVSGFEKVIIHESFDIRKLYSDDIGLIRLNKSIDFLTVKSFVAPICIPSANVKPRAVTRGRETISVGWGITENNSQSNVLLTVKLPLADEILCKNRYKDRFLPEQICVGGIKGKDTCSGDSGGPLFVAGPFGSRYLQIGIVSYGSFPCGRANIPAVYTSVSDYYDWILENIEP